MSPLLEARGIDTFYGSSHILRGVDFHVDAGETVTLLGRNGMGKTTLLRTLVGLTPARNGTVKLDGRDITRARTARIARHGVALVPEKRGIFPNLTVSENLRFAARSGPNGRADWNRDNVLAMFPRLAERAQNWGDQLSGGEQQMLTIARALMSNPTLILIDEATEGLAPQIRTLIWQTLKAIAAKGVAIVVVDKHLDDLFALANRHVVLIKGQIAFEGTTADMRANETQVRGLLGV